MRLIALRNVIRFASTRADVSSDGRVKTIWLDRSKNRNALSHSALKELRSHIRISEERDIRVMILRSSLPNIFSGGHDLKEFGGGNELAIFSELSALHKDIRECPCPVIGVIDGLAAASGCQLILGCDIVLATKTSSFSTPGASLGIFCSTPGVPLVRNANMKTATYMLLTGKPISASEALRAGMISKIVQDNQELESEARDVCEAIISKPKEIIALGKRFLYKQKEISSFEQALFEASKLMVENLKYKDSREGINAFLKKRRPNWSHSAEKTE